MEENNLIPLGSIVKLKNIKDRVMLIGIDQISDGIKFDYSGCIHPYGFLGSDKLLLFNADQIEEVVFKGFYDDEVKEYFEDILWAHQNKEEK